MSSFVSEYEIRARVKLSCWLQEGEGGGFHLKLNPLMRLHCMSKDKLLDLEAQLGCLPGETITQSER